MSDKDKKMLAAAGLVLAFVFLSKREGEYPHPPPPHYPPYPY